MRHIKYGAFVGSEDVKSGLVDRLWVDCAVGGQTSVTMAAATQCARTGVVFARYVSGVPDDAIQGAVESMVVLWRQPEMWMSPMSVERIRYSD